MDYSDILYNLDTTYTNLKHSEAIQKLFTKSINVSEAVVNILGNTGIAGFRFHINNSEQVKMESDITDHYVDTNSAVQDHIAIKPVIISVNGLQGEYFYSVSQLQDMLAKITPTMALVKQFLPKLSDATKQIKRKRIIKEHRYNAEINSLEASIRFEEHNLLFFMDRDIDAFLETGEMYSPISDRKHDFTDCVALTTFNPFVKPISNYDADSISIEYQNSSIKVKNVIILDAKDEVYLKSPAKVVLDTPNVETTGTLNVATGYTGVIPCGSTSIQVTNGIITGVV